MAISPFTSRSRRNQRTSSRGRRPRKRRPLFVELLEQRELLTVSPTFADGLLTLAAGLKDSVIVGSKDGAVTVNGEAIFEGSLKASAVQEIRVAGVISPNQVAMPWDNPDFSNLGVQTVSLAVARDPGFLELYVEALLGANWQEEYGWDSDTLRWASKTNQWRTLVEQTPFAEMLDAASAADAQSQIDALVGAAGLRTFSLEALGLWGESEASDSFPEVADGGCGCGGGGGMMMMSEGGDCPPDGNGGMFTLVGVGRYTGLGLDPPDWMYEHEGPLNAVLYHDNEDYNGARVTLSL